MRCARANSLIEPFVDGALSARRAGKLEAHISSCRSCARRLEAARGIVQTLMEEPKIRAPSGLLDAVMTGVYGLQNEPNRRARENRRSMAPAVQGRAVIPAPIYRRLGLSFLLTAAILTVSLLIPSLAYPSIIGDRVQVSSADVPVKRIMDGAGFAVRATLRSPGSQESGFNGGTPR
jgi:anti-sigma factor RsiW